jgi:hypothetical protein
MVRRPQNSVVLFINPSTNDRCPVDGIAASIRHATQDSRMLLILFSGSFVVELGHDFCR